MPHVLVQVETPICVTSEKRLSNALLLVSAETFLGDFSAPALDRILKENHDKIPQTLQSREVFTFGEKVTKVNFLSYLPSSPQGGLA